jgi:hypothetical protein
MSTHRVQEFLRYPKFYDNCFRAIERWLPKYLERCKQKHKEPYRKTAQEWMDWWLEIEPNSNIDDQQIDIYELIS